MKTSRSVVISMRLPTEIGNRLKRMAKRHGWTPSDASARLVEEGLRRSEFAFIDFRDSSAADKPTFKGVRLLYGRWRSSFRAIGPMSPP